MTEEYSSSNQQKAEPVPPTPAHGETEGSASAVSGVPGDARGVPVASEDAAEGTSETSAPVDGVRVTAIAPDGHADGETDARMPPTTTF